MVARSSKVSMALTSFASRLEIASISNSSTPLRALSIVLSAWYLVLQDLEKISCTESIGQWTVTIWFWASLLILVKKNIFRRASQEMSFLGSTLERLMKHRARVHLSLWASTMISSGRWAYRAFELGQRMRTPTHSERSRKACSVTMVSTLSLTRLRLTSCCPSSGMSPLSRSSTKQLASNIQFSRVRLQLPAVATYQISTSWSMATGFKWEERTTSGRSPTMFAHSRSDRSRLVSILWELPPTLDTTSSTTGSPVTCLSHRTQTAITPLSRPEVFQRKSLTSSTAVKTGTMVRRGPSGSLSSSAQAPAFAYTPPIFTTICSREMFTRALSMSPETWL